ncbi:leucine-rich repeat-containing protein 52-like [Tachypleus tridentatus]|uniref:leucine-rich repeat-containing protein 52-like n=1 Tax=Tachypleus tridentatus TaxID=6853 RepID=UPI003FD33A97
MPILMHVDLSRTNLHRLDQDVFMHIMDKMHLRVEALKITCDERILWLQEKKENVNAKNCTCAEPAEYKNWSLQRFFHQIHQI